MINPRYYPDIHGGGDKSIQFLAEGLVEWGYEVTVLATSKNGNYEEYFNKGVKVIKVKLWNLYWFPPVKPKNKIKKSLWHLLDLYNPFMKIIVKRVLESENPDLLHTHPLDGFSVSAWDAAFTKRIPIVHTLRGYNLLCPKATMFKNNKNCKKQCVSCSIFSQFQKPTSNKVKAVIGISNFVLQKHLDLGFFAQADHKVRIFNAFGTADVQQKKLDKTNEVIKLGYFGRLHQTKGIEIIIEVLKGIDSSKYELYLGGEGDSDYIKTLKNISENMPVYFIGQTSPELFFPRIDILLALSLWNEPLGRVVLEAFSFGIPVIGSSRGGIPEMINHGENGYIIDPENISALEKIILEIIINPDLSKMKSSAKQSSEIFLPETIINQHVDLYKKIIESTK